MLPIELLPADFEIESEPWMRDALCIEYTNVDFFPERGGSSLAAKRMCARCLLQRECLAFALEQELTAGIWGGTNARDRQALRRRGITGELIRRYGSNAVQGREDEREQEAEPTTSRKLPDSRRGLDDDELEAWFAERQRRTGAA